MLYCVVPWIWEHPEEDHGDDGYDTADGDGGGGSGDYLRQVAP